MKALLFSGAAILWACALLVAFCSVLVGQLTWWAGAALLSSASAMLMLLASILSPVYWVVYGDWYLLHSAKGFLRRAWKNYPDIFSAFVFAEDKIVDPVFTTTEKMLRGV